MIPHINFININKIIVLLFSFHGRLPRQNYCIGWIILFAIGFFSIWLPNQIPIVNIQSVSTKVWVITLTAVNLITFILMFFSIIAIHVKRFHDLNFSGWFTVFFFTPLNPLVLVICLLISGKKTPNRFGNHSSH